MDVPSTNVCCGTNERTASWTAFNQLPMIKFFNHDRRPVFILDVHQELPQLKQPIRPIFMNPALYKTHSLFDLVQGRNPDRCRKQELAYQSFLSWARRATNVTLVSEYPFGGTSWEATTLEDRWRVFVANPQNTSGGLTLRDPISSLFSVLPPSPSYSFDQAWTFPQVNPFEQNTRTVSPSNGPRTPGVQSPGRQSPWGRSPQDEFQADSFPFTSNSHADVVVRRGRLSSVVGADLSCAMASYEATQNAMRNANLLAKISGLGTIGICIVDLEGAILFSNDIWHEICQHPRDQNNAMAWMNAFEDEELPRIMDLWKDVVAEHKPIQFQARLKRRWVPSAAYTSAPMDLPAWISVSSYPDIGTDGEILGVCGVVTEISEQKWTESLMQQKLADAVERANLSEQLSASAKEVAATESRFHRLSDMMPIGIILSDVHGKVIYANAVYHDLIPGSRESASTEPWWEMIPEEDTDKVREIYRQLLEDHITITFELRLKTCKKPVGNQENEYRWVSASVYPELYEDGSLKYLAGCFTDISELKLAEQTQVARASDALQSKRQLEEFIDMTSHEMRNPLSAIIHSAEEILASLQDHDPQGMTSKSISSAMEAAETIIYCTDHSTRIVDDILLVSKLESGLLKISPTVVRPVDTIKQALKMFDGEMRAANISHSVTFDKSFDLLQIDWVHLDMNRVIQVLVNLLTNAIKFTRPEHIRRISTHIKASLKRPGVHPGDDGAHYLVPLTEPSSISGEEAVYISIAVTDTGCGLTEADQKTLFRRFSQAGKKTYVKYGGTGLGLFISRQLCEMQGGQIGVQSSPKLGSTFSFYIMAQRALPEEIPFTPGESAGERRGSRTTYVSTLPVTASRCRSAPPSNSVPGKQLVGKSMIAPQKPIVLLVEDNLINQKVVSKKLSSQGYTVIVANHGLEALDHIKGSALWSEASASATPISMILLDLEMPIMDGLTCIRRIREMEKSGQIQSHIPVIAVTANARQEQITQAKEAGMDDVVTKPFRMNQLSPAMTRLMEQFPTASSAGL